MNNEKMSKFLQVVSTLRQVVNCTCDQLETFANTQTFKALPENDQIDLFVIRFNKAVTDMGNRFEEIVGKIQ